MKNAALAALALIAAPSAAQEATALARQETGPPAEPVPREQVELSNVVSIEVTGARRYRDEELVAALGQPLGQPLDPRAVDAGVRNLWESLKVRAEVQYREVPGGVELRLIVTEMPFDLEPRYEADWDSLNTRPCPEWFPDAKFGIFIHWGVYSVPAWCDTSTYSEWYRHWVDTNAHDGKERRFHEEQYGADFAYEDFAPLFRAELFDPAEWADVFRRSGARYVVLTSKHHDGYALWPSAEASAARGHAWNSMEVGPGRDLVGELSDAVRAAGLRMGLYFSFMEWANPVFDRDLDEYVETVMIPQMKELVLRYRPAVFWPDGEWNHPDTTWRSTEFLAWLYANAPNKDELVVDDRWGKGLRGLSGDFNTTEYGRHAGEGATTSGKPWEECRGIGHSFAFNRAEGYDVYMSRTECVRLLVETVSRGGNLLLDIGPTADGRIPLIMQDRLLAMGRWLEANGEAIYGAGRSPFRSSPWGATTRAEDRLYLFVHDWPRDFALRVPGLASPVERAWLVHEPETDVPTRRDPDGTLVLDLAGRLPFEHATVVALELGGELAIDERPRPDADGIIVLHAEAAELFGEGLRLEPSGDGSFPGGAPEAARRPATNVGYWTEPGSGARWTALAEPDTVYDVLLVYGCSDGQEGSELAVRVGAEDRTATIARPTGGWHDYALLPADTARTGPEAELTVEVTLERPAAGAALNLRAVVLVPPALLWPEDGDGR